MVLETKPVDWNINYPKIGKTHFAILLGLKACDLGDKVLFGKTGKRNAYSLFEEIESGGFADFG